MHRKNRVPRGLLGGLLLLGLMFSLSAGGVRSAQGQPEKPTGPVVVPLSGVLRVSMAKRMIDGKEVTPVIVSAKSEKESVAIPRIDPTDPRSVLVSGIATGKTRILLAAKGDKEPEAVDVEVKAVGEERVLGQIPVSVKGTKDVQMAKRRVDNKEVAPNIEKAAVKDSDIVDVKGISPTTVQLTGKAPGITQLRLYAAGETEPEVYEVVVVEGVEFLRYLIEKSVPTANVVPIRGAGNSIVLTGWVAHSEDVDTVLRLARSFTAGGVGGAEIVNALKVSGVMEVQLDVVVARVARGEIRDMSFDLINQGQNHILGNLTGGAASPPIDLINNPVGAAANPFFTGTPNGAQVNGFLQIFSPNSGGQNFLILLQALRDNSLAKLLTEPRIVTLSGHPATINDGGEQPVPQVAGLGGAQGVTFLPFGTTVNFLPIVLGNGKIYLEVETTVENLDNSISFTPTGGTPVAGRSRQYIKTAAELQPGSTLVIGGLIQNIVQGTTSKVPVLGDIPFLGVAFSRKSFEETEAELIVMVTPHLVDPLDCTQIPKVLPGQETRSPDDFELFLEGLLEAPRGQRNICVNGNYMPAWKNSPTASKFPCGECGPCPSTRGGVGGGVGKGCNGGKCGAGCTAATTVPANPVTTMPETIVEVPIPMGSPVNSVVETTVPAMPGGVVGQDVIVPVSATEALPGTLPANR